LFEEEVFAVRLGSAERFFEEEVFAVRLGPAERLFEEEVFAVRLGPTERSFVKDILMVCRSSASTVENHRSNNSRVSCLQFRCSGVRSSRRSRICIDFEVNTAISNIRPDAPAMPGARRSV
jgi:hypothetical protein